MTLLDNRINAIVLVCCCVCDNKRCLGIISYLAQTNANKEDNTALLINNLEIIEVFKDKDKEEEVGIMDLIRQVLQLLRAELEELVDVAQAIMEPIKPCDEE